MDNTLNIGSIVNWFVSLLIITIGILNICFVHPVPGMVYLLLSAVYLPPVTKAIKNKLGFTMPLAVKIILGLALFFFTFGVSDLGDLIDKL